MANSNGSGCVQVVKGKDDLRLDMVMHCSIKKTGAKLQGLGFPG
jgi:hypothetical protein